ncbi:DUF1302 domain-containing protein [Halomonas campisalis]|uniref:DUF1302 domain-containing protein n=1 Tax=Billgrantia campisalis TaxID=74661 RepID=A0ABS9P6X9_9GAMM|nr:DUF1302 domain-containing protein [Halomonas campisalis]MCG6656992.1 DUF1302 domain-containing protein [Halomonas campisalis]MDR5862179.1 DUF1302 domain-containing protein [Halomonas campisalis]
MRLRAPRHSQALDAPHPSHSTLPRLLLVGLIASASGSAYGIDIPLGESASLSWDTTLRYSAGWRVQGQDKALLANPNADDGNRSFKRGLMQNRVDLLTEADLNFGNVGAFTRGRAYYDDAYFGANDHDSPATSNNQSVPHDRFTRDTRRLMGRKAEVLDAFVYGSFGIGSLDLDLRAGNQVINWGESLFLQGGISSAQGPLDATRANSPGVELREIFLPVGQLFAQLDLTGSLSLSAYYQYEWDKTRLNAAGSYFSSADFLDEGGESFILLPGVLSAQRSDDNEASDSGQYGLALRYLAEALNFTEFGLYHINYHDKLPQLQFDDFVMQGPGMVMPTSYRLEYEEDIKLYGASFSTVIGGANVSGEFSFRDGQPVRLAAPLPTYERANTWQAQLSSIKVLGGNRLMDNLNVVGEVGVNRVNGHDAGELHDDRSAWGFTARMIPQYFNVRSGLDLDVPITVSHGVNGTSSIPGTFTEGVTNVDVAAQFRYLDNYQASLGYTGFFGSANSNPQKDRDFVSLSVSYTF